MQKAARADEAEKNEPELDIPAEIARRQERRPKDKDGKPKAGKSYKRTLACQSPKRRTALLTPRRAS